jgi:hypothetical protein
VDHGVHSETLTWITRSGARNVVAIGRHADALVLALGDQGIRAMSFGGQRQVRR